MVKRYMIKYVKVARWKFDLLDKEHDVIKFKRGSS